MSTDYGISSNLYSEAEHLGIDRTLSVSQAMADFYLLERLVADGSRKARVALDELERKLAPQFVEYLGAICLGESRHVYGASELESSGSELDCGCHCMDCHYEQIETHYHSDEGCSVTVWSGPINPDCELEDPGEWSHSWDYNECGCHLEPVEYDCGYDDGDEINHCGVDDPSEVGMDASDPRVWDILNEFLSGYSRSDRLGCWHGWKRYSRDNGTVKALDSLVSVFTDIGWEGGYGGEAWGSIARVTRDYAAGKISRRVFINMVWSLQHNGGNVFNKMWKHEDCRRLQRLLERQAEDDYSFLAVAASIGARRIWQVRDYWMNHMFDRDDVWLGIQRTFTSEEVEW